MNFCRRCGEPLTNIEHHIYKCPNGHTLYANHSPVTGIFFVSPDNRRILLSTRGLEPHKGMLDALGGFLDANETLEEGAVRELREELDLNPDEYEPLAYLTSGHGKYPYQGEVIPFISALFWSRLKTDKELHPMDDVAAVNWYPLATLKPEQLHADDVRIGIRELQRILKEAH